MVASKCLELTSILVTGLLSTNFGVDGFEEPCLAIAVVKPTEETPDIFGFLNESMWFEHDGKFGCHCDLKMCIPLCCPDRYESNTNGCENENSIFLMPDNIDHEDTDHNVFTDDPCASKPTHSSLKDNDLNFLSNGSILPIAHYDMTDLIGHCLIREPNSRKYIAVRCTVSTWTHSRICFIASTSISMLFTLAAFIIYTVIPEVKNLQGSMCRCFLASHITGTFILTTTVNALLSDNLPLPTELFNAIAVLGCAYWFTACFLWMNVMSIDIWRTFRKFRSKGDNNIKKRQRVKFVCYSIYSWGGSAIFISLPICCIMTDSLNSIWVLILMCWAALTFFGIAICNIFLYISTALTIRQCKKEAAYRIIGMDINRQEIEEWFNLYVKLFGIMGGLVILFAVAFYWENDLFHLVLYALAGLQGVFIFLILVWKDEVKRSLGKRFHGTVLNLGAVLRFDTSPKIIEI